VPKFSDSWQPYGECACDFDSNVFALLNHRDKVVSRFERCRAEFADVSDLWLSAESSVQLLGHAATLQTDEESGICPSASLPSLPPAIPSWLSDGANSSGIGSFTETAAQSRDNSETPEVRLHRLKRLKDHLTKYIQRFKPDQLLPRHQCTCETERW